VIVPLKLYRLPKILLRERAVLRYSRKLSSKSTQSTDEQHQLVVGCFGDLAGHFAGDGVI
jgi:hypothetical protein